MIRPRRKRRSSLPTSLSRTKPSRAAAKLLTRDEARRIAAISPSCLSFYANKKPRQSQLLPGLKLRDTELERVYEE